MPLSEDEMGYKLIIIILFIIIQFINVIQYTK